MTLSLPPLLHRGYVCVRASVLLFITTNNNSKLVDRLLLAYIIILIEILLITTFAHVVAARQRENVCKLAWANSK